MHLPIYKTFDVVVVPFPFVDKAATKNRPALIISSSNFNTSGNSIAMMITSAAHIPWPHDTPITDLSAAGLNKDCCIRYKLFTIDNRLIKKKIGSLSKKDQTALTAHFQAVFKSMVNHLVS